MRKSQTALAACAALAVAAATTGARADVVFSEALPIVSGAFGAGTAATVDQFGPTVYGRITTVTGPGGGGNRAGAPVSTGAWLQQNVGGNASVGITNHYARSGTGSAYFAGASGDSKADLEFYFPAPKPLSSLTNLTYDWYRNGASTNPPEQHPALRLIVQDADTPAVFGYLVYEGSYNGQAVAPTNVWVTADVDGALFWATSALGASTSPNPRYDLGLAGWNALRGGDLNVLGVSFGIGSGWNGAFDGAVDNVAFAFADGYALATNFEVPEPAALAIFGAALVGLFALRRRPGDREVPGAPAAA